MKGGGPCAPFGGVGSVGDGREDGRRRRGAELEWHGGSGGEGVLVAQFGSSWVLEHHHATRNMRTGSGQSMRDGGGGSTASSSSPGLMADADRERRGSAPGSLPRGLYRLRALARKAK